MSSQPARGRPSSAGGPRASRTARESVVAVALDASAIPVELTGAGRYVTELAKALSARPDCALTVLARRDDADRWELMAPEARVLACAPSQRPLRLLYEQTGLPLAVAGLRSPAIAVHHGPHYTMPLLSRVPCVVTIHDLTLLEHPEWHESKKTVILGTAIRLAARRAAALVCVSDRTAARLDSLVTARSPIVVAPHGVDHQRYRATEADPGADASVLGRLGLDRPYLLHLGTLEPRKGLSRLVEAFELLARNHTELDLVLAGKPGWGNDRLDEAIRRGAAGSRVRKLGYVAESDTPALLRSAAVVAYPSGEEGFGLPVLEALACGAIVVTTTGTVMEDVAGGVAYLAPPTGTRALADALEAAVRDGERDDARTRSRRERGVAQAGRYTWEASAALHMKAYRLAQGMTC